MTDTPGHEPEGHEPEPEQRLPIPRPPAEAAPVERFNSPASTRAVELTPERFAQVVRQSSNARWIGFLAVVVVVLFVAIYWFYELGAPLGLSQARLDQELTAQQVTAVERGYNIYEANCARCHGKQGEGGIGPTLNRQDKLFAHLSEDYIRTMLLVGGRYACGDPLSLMPVWSDQGHPPGPLNYRQIDELVAFLRAPSTKTFTIRNPELLDPIHDPVTGQIETFKGWRDPSYAPAPGATPFPACWKTEFAPPSADASGGASAPASSAPAASAPAPSGSPAAAGSGSTGQTVTIVAAQIAFNPADVTAPAGKAFTLEFDNQDASTPHDVLIKDASGAQVFKSDVFPGVSKRTYQMPALAAGTYSFSCTVHPNMTGTLTAG